MGYYDEKFMGDLLFAMKFIATLVIIRLIAYYFGYHDHIPVIDDLIVWTAGLIKDFGKMVEAIASGNIGK